MKLIIITLLLLSSSVWAKNADRITIGNSASWCKSGANYLCTCPGATGGPECEECGATSGSICRYKGTKGVVERVLFFYDVETQRFESKND